MKNSNLVVSSHPEIFVFQKGAGLFQAVCQMLPWFIYLDKAVTRSNLN